MAVHSSADAANDCKGVFLVITSEVLLALVNTIVKYVHNWSTQKIMIVRNSTDFCLCLAMCMFFKFQVPGWKVALFCAMRGIAYISFIVCFWASLRSCVPLGDVVTTLVTFSPLFLVMLARVTLGEKIPKMWPLQVTLCAIGAVLINKPMAPDRTCPLSSTSLPILAAFAATLINFSTRNVKTVPPPVLNVFNDIFAVAYAVLSTAIQEESSTALLPDRIDSSLGLLILAGVIGWAGLLCNIKGFQSVSVAATAGIAAYSSVPVGYIIRTTVFGEKVDLWSAAGATLIVCTNVTVIISKAFAAKRATAEKEEQLYKPLPHEAGTWDQAAGA